VLGLLAALACGEPTEPPGTDGPGTGTPDEEAILPTRDASPIQTESLLYVLRHTPGQYEAWAQVNYTNLGATPVYLQQCTRNAFPIYGIQRAPPDTGAVFLGPIWGCGGGVPPIVIAPGAARRDSVHLVSTEAPLAQPPIGPHERVGLFRVVYYAYSRDWGTSDPNDADLLPIAQRQSNVFRVRYCGRNEKELCER
jgi:hypothetical protein